VNRAVRAGRPEGSLGSSVMLESHDSGHHLPEFVPVKIPWLPALASLVTAVLLLRLLDQFIFGAHQTVAAVVRWLTSQR
jgi:hypothetical protein